MAQPATNDSQHVGHEMIGDTLDAPIVQYDLLEEVETLHKEDAWLKGSGPSSKTLVKHSDLRIVLIAMRKKMSMHEHRTAARLSVQTLVGHIRLTLADRTVDLAAGQLLVLDQCVPHDVEAEKDSAFLLTLSWHGKLSDPCQAD